jgi:hypothetical protein
MGEDRYLVERLPVTGSNIDTQRPHLVDHQASSSHLSIKIDAVSPKFWSADGGGFIPVSSKLLVDRLSLGSRRAILTEIKIPLRQRKEKFSVWPQ